MRVFLRRLRQSAFVARLLVVMSGTAVAQIIGLSLAPIISRLFSPTDFGVFASFMAILGVVAAAATLDYADAIMLPEREAEASNLFALSCLSTAIVSIGILAAYTVAPGALQTAAGTTEAWMPALLGVAVFVTGINRSLQAWCIRAKKFKHTSASQVFRSVSSNGVQVGFGLLNGGPLALVSGLILGDTVASIGLARAQRHEWGGLSRAIRWQQISQLAKDYRDFPLYSASQKVINALSAGSAVLLLTQFYGVAIAGAYAFAYRILAAPLRLPSVALRQVLFQKAAEARRSNESLTLLYLKVTAGLFALAIVPSVIMFMWAPIIFSWVFGARWHTAGEYAGVLSIWLLFSFCNLPAVLFAKTIRIQRLVFVYDLCLLGMRVAVLVVGGGYLASADTVMLFSLVGAVMNVVLICGVGYIVMRDEGYSSWGHAVRSLTKG